MCGCYYGMVFFLLSQAMFLHNGIRLRTQALMMAIRLTDT